MSVTRSEYQESGSNACLRKFDSANWQERDNEAEAPQGGQREAARSRVKPRASKLPEGSAGGEGNPSRPSRSRAAKKG